MLNLNVIPFVLVFVPMVAKEEIEEARFTKASEFFPKYPRLSEVKLIKKIIQTEIRPQVALDGGDIIFHSYKDGVVAIHMQGACAGCPSSSITLKQGIETRLKQALPEIDEVIAI